MQKKRRRRERQDDIWEEPGPPGYTPEDYDFEMPEELIAQRPAERRDESRLLVIDRKGDRLIHARFPDIKDYLQPGDLLLLNDTRVMPARIFGLRSTGGKVEALFIREEKPGVWEIMLRCGGNPRPGEVISLAEDRLRMRLLQRTDEGWLAAAPKGCDARAVLQEHGRMPVPPYIKRGKEPAEDEESLDRDRYQTVYAKEEGAVAAPTAGLHFTEGLLEEIQAKGIRATHITLHVGPGTFRPVRAEDIRRHKMHSEFYRISEETARAINETEAAGGRIISVGTTCCRVLETMGDRIEPGEGWTDIFIHPPYKFRHADALLTNFHLPRSTLLMLVSAFAAAEGDKSLLTGRDRILRAYREAVKERYRFYSYGDATLII